MGIPIDYLLQLEGLHDQWLLNNPKTIVLDGEHQWQAQEIFTEIGVTP